MGPIMKTLEANDEIRITRCSLLSGALATATLAFFQQRSGTAVADTSAATKDSKAEGPFVFLDYDQKEIDLVYDQAPWAPNAAKINKRNAQKSAAALAHLGPPRRVPYDSSEIEKIDIYISKQPTRRSMSLFTAGMLRARLTCPRLSWMQACISYRSTSIMRLRSTATL